MAAFLEAHPGYVPDGWASRELPPLVLPASPPPPPVPAAEEEDDAASMDSETGAAIAAAADDADHLNEDGAERELARLAAVFEAAALPHTSAFELMGYREPAADAADMRWRQNHLDDLFFTAAKHGRVDVAELLKDAVTPPFARHAAVVDRDMVGHFYEVQVATVRGHGPMLQFLIANGADVTRRDLCNRTPAEVADQNGHAAIAAMLRNHAAAAATAAAAAAQ